MALDALGREVPGWAREAFDLLAADGRRVAVTLEPDARDAWKHPQPYRETDTQISQTNTCGDAEVFVYGNRRWVNTREHAMSLADCARRALAMEAERNAHPVHAVKLPPMDEAKRAEVLDALRALSADHRAVFGPRRHNATCPRCYGPAYHGFGYAPTCEREGGCLADREPYVTTIEDHDASEDEAGNITVGDVWQYSVHVENGWTFAVTGDVARRGFYATRDLAIAAWREAVLARAKQEADK